MNVSPGVCRCCGLTEEDVQREGFDPSWIWADDWHDLCQPCADGDHDHG